MEAVCSLVRLLVKLELLEKEPHLSTYGNKPELPLRLLGKLGRIDEYEAVKKIAAYLDIPLLDLSDKTTEEKLSIEDYRDKLDSQLCWQEKIIPLWEENNRIFVAMANPLDLDTLQSLCFPFGKKGAPVMAFERDVIALLRENLPPSKIQFDTLAVSDEEDDESIEILSVNAPEKSVSARQTEAKPIIRLCNKLIADAHQMEASDIHLHPMDGALEVRFRIDGVMHSIMEVPARLQQSVISRLKLLAGMDIADHRKPQDGRFGVKIDGQPLDVRVSCIPTSYGENLVLRLLNNDCSDLSFESLGFPAIEAKRIQKVLASHGKMLLVTGPTGSGKTTTLYTCLNTLRDGTINIETVEDPIEYRVPGVQQIQVNETAGITFASALRTILRQDPDVIMIGEIRDEETAKIALQAAQTGHLVLSTLHTNDAPSAITRLFDLHVPPFLVSASLAGIVAQRLVRTICQNCTGTPGKEYLSEFSHEIAEFHINSQDLFLGIGCEECHYTGYKGRTAIYSFLEVTDEIERLIHEKAATHTIVEAARKTGFQTLEDQALLLLQQGRTSFYEVVQYLTRKESSEKIEEKLTGATYLPEISSDTDPEALELKTGISSGIDQELVLLIEDDPDIRSILSLLLQKEMYEVIEAENGLEGLQAVYDKRPTLIVADLMMPKMDGKEFLVKMKNNAKTKDIPILILTAANSEENEVELLDLGANDFVRKGASSYVFLSRVRRALAESQ